MGLQEIPGHLLLSIAYYLGIDNSHSKTNDIDAVICIGAPKAPQRLHTKCQF